MCHTTLEVPWRRLVVRRAAGSRIGCPSCDINYLIANTYLRVLKGTVVRCTKYVVSRSSAIGMRSMTECHVYPRGKGCD